MKVLETQSYSRGLKATDKYVIYFVSENTQYIRSGGVQYTVNFILLFALSYSKLGDVMLLTGAGCGRAEKYRRMGMRSFTPVVLVKVYLFKCHYQYLLLFFPRFNDIAVLSL